MNILVTLDSNYIMPLKVMLKSMFLNNKTDIFTIYLMHSNISDTEISDLNDYIITHGSQLKVIYMDDDYFSDAPTHAHYTKEMYYRLLAYKYLPRSLDRILYLDPDILVINSLEGLYNTDFEGNWFAAAYHDIAVSVNVINKARFYPYQINNYYNSGVLLMNLELLRENMDEKLIYKFVKENHSRLILPDQDVLNAMFGKQIKPLDEKMYNYDVRYYHYYKRSKFDMNDVIYHTVILHFCGKKKPWDKNYSGVFHSLYKHYEKATFMENDKTL